MVRSDRLLMGPGPCNPCPEAVAALSRPMLSHLDPELLADLDETCDRLRTVFRAVAEVVGPRRAAPPPTPAGAAGEPWAVGR